MGAKVIVQFLLGIVFGIVTGIPIGPVNVAVIDAAYRHCVRRAIAVGLGGAVGDFLYVLLGIVIIGPLFNEYPLLPPVLYGISGIVLIVYGLLTARAQPVDRSDVLKNAHDVSSSQHVLAGFGLGLALIIVNPGAMVTWVLIVGPFFADVSFMGGLMAAAGVAVGSFMWFSFVAYLADHGKRILGDKAIWITRIVGLLLVGYGFYALSKLIIYIAG